MPTSSENDAIIRLDRVSKRYHLLAGQKTLREVASTWARNVLRGNGRGDTSDALWALRDVSFEVKRGEALGLVGLNGAGKTTILKLISRVTRPTVGTVSAHGRLSSLIELGAGFHPDLSGRENVFLNGVILGLTRRQVAQRFDDIVAFAEMKPFIDIPVKRYSSGMHARLGFAVAAHVDPDILLVDEIFAVGDASFQRKCYDYIHGFLKSGRTAIFVSHYMSVVEQLCSRVLWLDHGRVAMIGEPGRVLNAYLDSVDQRALMSATGHEHRHNYLRVIGMRLADGDGQERQTFRHGEDIVITIQYSVPGPVERPHFVLAVADAQGGPPLFLASMLVDGQAPVRIAGQGSIKCRLKAVPLMPRVYAVWGEVWGADRTRALLEWQRLGAFRIVEEDDRPREMQPGGIRHVRVDGPVRVPYEWEIGDGCP
ncbi:MAG: transporter related protein [Deltaproteobacteria bacterium]|nr:transporter related protein [Deltaproteobacteria bacterium]